MISQGKVSIDTLRSGKKNDLDTCANLCEKIEHLNTDPGKEFEEDDTSIYEYDYECLRRKQALLGCTCSYIGEFVELPYDEKLQKDARICK